MDRPISSNSRLSRIDTLWSVVRRAHNDESAIASSAQQQLLEIYGGAIRRYLVASLKNSDVAEDLFQEFAIKFVQGDFRGVDPRKGRFRSFVKTVLYRMIALHHRKKSKHNSIELNHDPEQTPADTSDEDERFLASWRDDLLARTWQSLADHESETGAPYYSILRLRVANPSLSSEELAVHATEQIGKNFTSGSARVTLHRAREKFAKLMIDVVASSLDNPTRDDLEDELVVLQLIDYCRDALQTSGKTYNP